MGLEKDLQKAEYEVLHDGVIDKNLEEEILTELEGQRNFKSGPLYWLIALVAFTWSVYQLYVTFFPINSTLVRSTHLAFAMVLAFLIYPIVKKPKQLKKISILDYIFAIVGGLGAAYIAIDYIALSNRVGDFLTRDIAVGIISIILLLEAGRRVIGLALSVVAIVFLSYYWVKHSAYISHDVFLYKSRKVTQELFVYLELNNGSENDKELEESKRLIEKYL